VIEPGAGRHVLVTDASRGSAVAFIRSLGRRGWRVTAADADPRSPGFHSRWTTTRLRYPDPALDADAAVETIIGAIERTGVDLVVPVTDDIGLPLAAHRDRIDGRAVLAFPHGEALAVVHDKARTIALAERLGVPVPPTRSVTDVTSGIEAARDLGWPVVIKPQASRVTRRDGTVEAFSVSYAADEGELRMRIAELEGRTDILLQRWRPGEGHGVELLTDGGRLLAGFQHRRLREVPVTGGASSLRESVPLDPVLLDHAMRLLGELRWTGLAMVEFRSTPEGPELMEINGRVWGSLPLAVRSGIDFPARLADLLLVGPPPAGTAPATTYRVGVRARNLRLETTWIGNVAIGRRRYRSLPFPSRRAALGALASLFDPRIGDDLLTRDDPRPGLAQFAGIAGRLLPGGHHRVAAIPARRARGDGDAS
jgi:predicted ATP-grasp superfamily ATP-dependent carboligase